MSNRSAFAAGKLIVEMDIDSKKQRRAERFKVTAEVIKVARFVQGHSATVTCIAYSEQQALGASGQVLRSGAKWAEVLLWDSESLEICACFSFHQANVDPCLQNNIFFETQTVANEFLISGSPFTILVQKWLGILGFLDPRKRLVLSKMEKFWCPSVLTAIEPWPCGLRREKDVFGWGVKKERPWLLGL